MEFMPSTTELSPKTVIVLNSLALVAATALALRCWLRRTALVKADGGQIAAGRFQLTATDFGPVSETQRDACRAFCAKCIYLLPTDSEAAVPLRPPDGLPAGVDSAAVALQLKAFAAALREKMGAFELSDEAFTRLLPSAPAQVAIPARHHY